MSTLAALDHDPRWRAPNRSYTRYCPWCPGTSRGSTEDRAPCASCGARTCDRCARPCPGCALLSRIRAACDGAPTRGDDGDAKAFHIVRTLGRARDVLVAPSGIVV